jgi:DNA-binding response OmpR family regulator
MINYCVALSLLPAKIELARRFEEENGFRVDSFNDPLIALSNFRPGSYELVILDIKMPQMDGFELYQEMKKQDIKNQSLLFNS